MCFPPRLEFNQSFMLGFGSPSLNSGKIPFSISVCISLDDCVCILRESSIFSKYGMDNVSSLIYEIIGEDTPSLYDPTPPVCNFFPPPAIAPKYSLIFFVLVLLYPAIIDINLLICSITELLFLHLDVLII